MKTPREKYQHDPNYRVLVDTLCAHIHACNFTPSEIRQAALLACILYEEQKIRTTIFPKFPDGIEKALDSLYEWANKQC